MTITRVKTFNRPDAIAWKYRRRATRIHQWLQGSPWALITIADTPRDATSNPLWPLGESMTNQVLSLQFDDVEEGEGAPGVPMSRAQAQAVVAFVRSLVRGQANISLMVQCVAGVSRSGAIAEWAKSYANLGNEPFQTDNTGIHPNQLVLFLLREAVKK